MAGRLRSVGLRRTLVVFRGVKPTIILRWAPKADSMVRATTSEQTDFALDGLLAGLGVLFVVVGLGWVITHPGSFVFLPLDLLGVLIVAGGALLLVAGLLGHVGDVRMMGTLLTVLVVVSAIVATIVTATLAIF